jgi:nitrous oxidase accessory protein NosD
VGDGTTVEQNVITSAQSGIFINGGSHLQIEGNYITDIDLLDGIDIQGTASGFLTDSLVDGNTIVDLGPVRNENCGIFEFPRTGVSGNTISNTTVNDAYCGVAYVSSDHVEYGFYSNTLYTQLNASLPSFPPPPVEPGQTSGPSAKQALMPRE